MLATYLDMLQVNMPLRLEEANNNSHLAAKHRPREEVGEPAPWVSTWVSVGVSPVISLT